jgi:HD-like signal output (HDOD) protein
MQTTATETAILNLKAVSARTGDLPPIPAIAMRALAVTKDPKASARDVQTAIAQDQALSARILRIVNSAMYGLSREVSTISHAVAILGMDTLRSILMAAAAQQVLNSGGRGQDLTSKLLSDHSWGAGLAARIIAQRTR